MTSRTATREATLCRIFADVLDLDLVVAHDAFFEVGGDSVLALAVVARAREAGLALSVRDLFDHQTPAALADVTGDLQGPDGTAPGGTAPGQPPLVSFTCDGTGEFDDAEADEQVSYTETGWETPT